MNQYCVMRRVNDGEWYAIAACDTLKAAKAFISRDAKGNKSSAEAREYQVVIAVVNVETSMSVLYTRRFP